MWRSLHPRKATAQRKATAATFHGDKLLAPWILRAEVEGIIPLLQGHQTFYRF